MKQNKLKFFETHAHYDDEQFDADREELLPLLHESGIIGMVNITYDRKSNARAYALAQKYPYVYATVGYHPCDCQELNEEAYKEMCDRIKNPKVVAIGEIGLDYHWDHVAKEIQYEKFRWQLDLAKKETMPIVVHSREAAQDTFDIIEKYGHGQGVIHCYAYSVEMAREYVKLGYYLGIGGVVTFKNAKNIKKVVEEIPLSHIVLETDSPYLAPSPFRGKRNSSAYLIYIAQKIADIKGVCLEEVCEITCQNAIHLYRLDSDIVSEDPYENE